MSSVARLWASRICDVIRPGFRSPSRMSVSAVFRWSAYQVNARRIQVASKSVRSRKSSADCRASLAASATGVPFSTSRRNVESRAAWSNPPIQSVTISVYAAGPNIARPGRVLSENSSDSRWRAVSNDSRVSLSPCWRAASVRSSTECSMPFASRRNRRAPSGGLASGTSSGAESRPIICETMSGNSTRTRGGHASPSGAV
jgi:hypothetical protein